MSVSTPSALISTFCFFKVIPFPTLEKTPCAVLELLRTDPGLTVREFDVKLGKSELTIH